MHFHATCLIGFFCYVHLASLLVAHTTGIHTSVKSNKPLYGITFEGVHIFGRGLFS